MDRIVTKNSPHRRRQLRRIGAYIAMIRKERDKNDKR